MTLVDFDFFPPPLLGTKAKDTEDSIEHTFGTAAKTDEDEDNQSSNYANNDACNGTCTETATTAILRLSGNRTTRCRRTDESLRCGNLPSSAGGRDGNQGIAGWSEWRLGRVGRDSGDGEDTAVESRAATACVFALAR